MPPRPRRIVMHWTGGGDVANRVDRRAYHYLVQQDGSIVHAVPVEWNLRSIPRGTPTTEYAAHTGGLNSWSVGVSLCGMRGAKEGGPFGPDPITEVQVDAMCRLVARMCRDWSLPVDADHIFHHAEAWTIHRVQQARGKWDITVLPWDLSVPPDEVGFWLRARINHYLMEWPEPTLREVRDVPRVPELRPLPTASRRPAAD